MEHMVVKGLAVVPVKFDDTRTTVQYLYMKQHDVRQNEDDIKPKDRTLFVGNTPPWATEESFENAFSCCGKVEKVYFHSKPCTGKPEETAERNELFPKMDHKVAYVVFKSKDAVNKALHLSYSKPLIFSTKEAPIVHGVARYKEMYLKSRNKNVAEMKKAITDRIKLHDQNERERAVFEALTNGEPDKDGWVVVTRVGKNKGAPRTDAEDRRVKQREARKRKKKELTNFYAFQTREEKRQKIEELRHKFEMDKSKVELMKAQRKFNPF